MNWFCWFDEYSFTDEKSFKLICTCVRVWLIWDDPVGLQNVIKIHWLTLLLLLPLLLVSPVLRRQIALIWLRCMCDCLIFWFLLVIKSPRYALNWALSTRSLPVYSVQKGRSGVAEWLRHWAEDQEVTASNHCSANGYFSRLSFRLLFSAIRAAATYLFSSQVGGLSCLETDHLSRLSPQSHASGLTSKDSISISLARLFSLILLAQQLEH